MTRPVALIGVAVTGLVLAVAVIGGAFALGGTSEIASPDPAQPIVAGIVAVPGEELTGNASLPPLALVTDEAVPPAIADLSADDQARAFATQLKPGDARTYIRYGAALQRADDQAGAETAYRTALAADSESIAAEAGLALVDGASGDAGLARAADFFQSLVATHPDSQLAWFNRGWVATYSRDAPTLITAWTRVVAIDPATPLGRAAIALLKGIAGTTTSTTRTTNP
ncbi:MAG: hypothetical protein EXQ74_04875 [Thermoleophilia bacterium]|nr:hypothetical protein [Thermoleophilia bacterium]